MVLARAAVRLIVVVEMDARLQALLRHLTEAAKLRPDYGHEDADDALLEYIDNPEVTAAYRALTRWYA